MLMSDHINCPGMAGFHPLRGPNDDKFGPRFPPMNQAYDKEIRELARKGYTELGIPQQEGTYAFVCGSAPRPSSLTRAPCLERVPLPHFNVLLVLFLRVCSRQCPIANILVLPR